MNISDFPIIQLQKMENDIIFEWNQRAAVLHRKSRMRLASRVLPTTVIEE